MNNKFYLKHRLGAIAIALCTLLTGANMSIFAQTSERKVTGTVTDEAGEPLIGASIAVPGTGTGTITDFDGNYSLAVPMGSDRLMFSYIGYTAQTLTIPPSNVLNAKLMADAVTLSDVVVIGYGTQKKSDLTGSISNVSAKDFNGGLIASADQLINGKMAGVQILSSSGSPTAGSSIRIRGGASLNASNDPLIVLDGVPLESGGISGSGNFLSLINPNDIENITILKDASSTAIYGSRASNGVMIITTKKGTGSGLKVAFSTTNSVQTNSRMVDMMNTDQFINTISTYGTDAQRALLGSNRTNWNDEVYHTAFGTDNNLSLSGRITENLPIRVSIGYYNQDGIVRTDNAERYTGSINLTPSFFDDHLKVGINAKGSQSNSRFILNDAIWAAATFNPTLPVYDASNPFGGYNEAIDNEGNPANAAVRNPRGLIDQYTSKGRVSRLIGNIDVDYKFHFLPEMRFHVTAGYDYARGKGSVYIPAEAAINATTGGRDYDYGPQKKTNRLLTTYLNYNKQIDGRLPSTIDATAGYDYQFWKSTNAFYTQKNVAGDIQSTSPATDQRHALISGYARLNYTLTDRYMLTATVRRDGTSRFHKDHRWGTFPSVALAWRVSEESFLKNQQVLSNLKLRLSYGVTGQQEGIGNYNYLPVYTYSQNGAEAQFGNEYIYTYRPEAYVQNLKWETTTAWNAGIDFGFLKDRISGSVDVYARKTKDLLATVPAPAGTTFDKQILTNVGNVDSHGIEVALNATPIDNRDWRWDISYNFTWQKSKLKNLSLVQGGEVTNTLAGPSIDSYQLQVLTEGYEPYMFYLYHQLYDQATGKPIEGAYADLNDDGVINSSDLYRYHSAAPDYIMGLSTSLNYKQWTVSTSLRANIGNYVYNGMAMNTGAWSTVSYNSYQLNNLNRSFLHTGFVQRQHLSDYYVENASFLKMDNITLAYNFGEVVKGVRLNASAMVQNVFCWTKYSGVDPEIPNGLDMNFYPRPRTFSLSLGLEF